MSARPTVSILVPCYNEQATIRLLLDALCQQSYPVQQMEVIVADGMSLDNTRSEIRAFHSENPELKISVIDNPERIIPIAVNRAIKASSGDILIRMDAHSVPNWNYVESCVNSLEAGLGKNVGGVWDIQPGGSGLIARGIAIAAAHPLGVGDARYRFAETPQSVDTVPFGAFYRTLIDEIGFFNEELLTNEDYEFNARIRQRGGRIWLDPVIRSRYYARKNLGDLARQYWRYGYWKVQMLRKFPQTLRWRQSIPPLFVLSLLFLGIGALIFDAFRWMLILELLAYGSLLLVAGIQQAFIKNDIGLIFGVPAAIACMHFAWGSAFLWAVFRVLLRLPV